MRSVITIIKSIATTSGLRRNLGARSTWRRCFSDSTQYYLGVKNAPFTTTMQFTSTKCTIPTYRVLDNEGNLIENDHTIQLNDNQLLELYKGMVILRTMDTIFYDIQRQGRISFYMTSTGEEALQFGSASALSPDDIVYGQYREPGVIMYRGYTLDQFASQCFSVFDDLGKGRQMPVHYGSRGLHYHTISSPLTTQLPQAAGAAYAMKREGKGRCVICYFGDGAASEGDFHPAMNFAVTRECPVIFFCRNNGYAISTPIKDQYGGDGIAPRALGYGMEAIRVDGNDIIAVHEVIKEARNRAVSENRPILIEAMSYRRGHHSTSDDSTAYRSAAEISQWQTKDDPIVRTRLFLMAKGIWSDEQETAHLKDARDRVIAAVNTAEKKRKPSLSEMFTDVYDEIPAHLQEQQQQLDEHLRQYSHAYKLEQFHKD